jgi:hypothetical protein
VIITDLSYDEAKAEVERLLLTPLQIGSAWASRHGNFSVVLHGVQHGFVYVRNWGDHSSATHRIVDFHANFALIPWNETPAGHL